MLTRTRIITMLVIAISTFLVYVAIVYYWTGWNPANFKSETLTAVAASTSVMSVIVAATLGYGLKPLWDSYPRKDEKKTASETMIEKYQKHTLELTEKLDAHHNKLNSDDEFPLGFTWWHTLELFDARKEYLQHLITGKPNLYDMMSEVLASEGKDEKFKQFNEQMGEFVKAVLAGGEPLKGCCSSCKGMFPPDEMAECERKFTELENTPLYKKWFRQY